MWMRNICALLCIFLPAAVLSSMGCGILLLPVDAPGIAAANMRTIRFTVDIVDGEGAPLDGVSVQIVPHAIKPTLFMGAREQSVSVPPRAVDKTFSYSTFGNATVVVTYAKPGFAARTISYTSENIGQGQTNDSKGRGPRFGADINTAVQPHTTVVLYKLPAQ